MLRKLPPPGPLEGGLDSPKKARIAAPQYAPMWGDDANEPPLPAVLAPILGQPERGKPALSLEQAQDMLRAKAIEYVDASPARVSTLNVEIQKLRIICMVLREVELGVSDPNTYKELNLMNKMLTGKDIEGDADRQQTEQEEAEATAALEKRGLKAESAGRILRALTAILDKSIPDEPTDDEPEPPDPTGIP